MDENAPQKPKENPPKDCTLNISNETGEDDDSNKGLSSKNYAFDVSDGMGEENISPKKRSVKNYALQVFKESSVSILSGVLTTGSTPSKIFRTLVFIIFSTAFLYQCIKFLTYVLQYPTVVDIIITKPDMYLMPAYTFCNNNHVQRSKFCKKYPSMCKVPDDKFCAEHKSYCGSNRTLVPIEDFYETNYSGNVEELIEFSQSISDFFHWGPSFEGAEPEGPLVRQKEKESDGISLCYTLNSRVNSPLDPSYTEAFLHLFNGLSHAFLFDVQVSETFNPNTQAGLLFSLHSPFDAVNPFKRGIFMRPGRMYKVFYKMTEEKLLPYPYQTDCLNYTEMWEKNNRKGPRSQKACREKCIQEFAMECLNCTFLDFNYPIEGKACDGSLTEEDVENCPLLEVVTCLAACKDECSIIKFEYDVQQRFSTLKPNELPEGYSSKDIASTIYVEIELGDEEIMSLYHKPQYQEVEAFSYIGGFIGIWLGISLVQVADFLESIFRIVRYSCKKFVPGSSRKGATRK